MSAKRLLAGSKSTDKPAWRGAGTTVAPAATLPAASKAAAAPSHASCHRRPLAATQRHVNAAQAAEEDIDSLLSVLNADDNESQHHSGSGFSESSPRSDCSGATAASPSSSQTVSGSFVQSHRAALPSRSVARHTATSTGHTAARAFRYMRRSSTAQGFQQQEAQQQDRACVQRPDCAHGELCSPSQQKLAQQDSTGACMQPAKLQPHDSARSEHGAAPSSFASAACQPTPSEKHQHEHALSASAEESASSTAPSASAQVASDHSTSAAQASISSQPDKSAVAHHVDAAASPQPCQSEPSQQPTAARPEAAPVRIAAPPAIGQGRMAALITQFRSGPPRPRQQAHESAAEHAPEQLPHEQLGSQEHPSSGGTASLPTHSKAAPMPLHSGMRRQPPRAPGTQQGAGAADLARGADGHAGAHVVVQQAAVSAHQPGAQHARRRSVGLLGYQQSNGALHSSNAGCKPGLPKNGLQEAEGRHAKAAVPDLPLEPLQSPPCHQEAAGLASVSAAAFDSNADGSVDALLQRCRRLLGQAHAVDAAGDDAKPADQAQQLQLQHGSADQGDRTHCAEQASNLAQRAPDVEPRCASCLTLFSTTSWC